MRAGKHNIDPATLSLFTLRKVVALPDLRDSDRQRFWAKVRKGAADECWMWLGGGVPNGHGSMGLGSRPNVRPYYAHRIAWTIANGPIPDGMAVLHSCDVRRCCNPAHLFIGSQADNVRDAAAKNRLNVPRPNHPRRKLSDAQVSEILNLHAAGMRQVDLAAKFSVSEPCISQLVKGLRRVYRAPQLQAEKRRTA